MKRALVPAGNTLVPTDLLLSMFAEEKKRLTQAVLTISKLHGMNSSVYSVWTHECPVRDGGMRRMEKTGRKKQKRGENK